MVFSGMMRNSWIRRRWLDFRQGHTIYLVFLMTFANFVTIQYSLLIERIPAFNSFLPNMWVFTVIFVAAYVPLAIIIGYWHRKSQWKVEAEALFKENPISATMWLFVIDLIDGKVTEEEKKEMRAMLLKIARRGTLMPAIRKSEQEAAADDGTPQKQQQQQKKDSSSNKLSVEKGVNLDSASGG